MMTYDTLHDRLRGPIIKALKDELKIKNTLALPRLEKVVVNVGINKSKMDGKETQAYIVESLKLITGQQPVLTHARKAISNFKVRSGMVVGVSVTLRGKKMEEFLDRFISYSIPRTRDFRGLNTKLDGHGNYSIGLRDYSIFPELPPVDAKQIFGMQVTISTTAKNDEEGLALLKAIGIPFKPSQSAENKEEEAQKEKALKEKKDAEEVLKEEAKPAEEAASDDKKEEKSDDKKADKKEDGNKDDSSVASKGDATDTNSPKSDS